MSYSIELRNAKLAANATVIGNAGIVKFFTGAKPATGGAETTLLASEVLGSPFAPAPVNGVQSPTIPASVNAVATGTCGWARVDKADGVTPVMDLTVGVAGSGAQIILSTLSFVSNGPVSITSWAITAADA